MTKKRRTVQPEDIIAINEAYLKIGTYAGAGRATGWSGSTVKRYIIPDYEPQANQEPVIEEKFEIPDAETLVYPENWETFLTLTEEELESCKTLQKSILL